MSTLQAHPLRCSSSIFDWLMEGDPAIRYQTLRDLTDAHASAAQAEQNRIGTEGWGARLLDLQDKAGTWAQDLYSPKWISTHYTLMLLLRLGLAPDNAQARKGVHILLDQGFDKKNDGGISFFPNMTVSETCVTGMCLSLFSYFGVTDERLSAIVEYLIHIALEDGGWNCRAHLGDTHHSSFHTTICVLEGLQAYTKRFPDQSERLLPTVQKGREFLLQHHLFQSDRTGKTVDVRMTRLSFPPRWKHDIIRTLDYFQESNAPWDPRCQAAINLIRKKEKARKWPLQQKHSGKIWFDLEKVGQPSRMNTLRALRILNWWEGNAIA